jgi:ubiquinone/menaquinone biosynthesis C-methylase UbiE
MRSEWILERIPSEGRVLDIGFVGTRDGDIHRLLRAALPRRTIVGMDIDLDGIRRMKLPATVAGDATRLPFADASFSTVVMAEILEHIPNPTGLLPEVARVLARGGRFIATTPNPYYPARWLKCWLFAANPVARQNVRRFLGSHDHISLLEPLSLCHALDRCGLDPHDLTTQKFTVPFLGRVLRRGGTLNLPWYPFNRLGGYLCVMSIKR